MHNGWSSNIIPKESEQIKGELFKQNIGNNGTEVWNLTFSSAVEEEDRGKNKTAKIRETGGAVDWSRCKS